VPTQWARLEEGHLSETQGKQSGDRPTVTGSVSLGSRRHMASRGERIGDTLRRTKADYDTRQKTLMRLSITTNDILDVGHSK
jgi:hypothetical protein